MKPNCYVCGNTIQGIPVYIGQDLHRHMRCEPGSKRWMTIHAARPAKKRSPMYEYFLEAQADDKKELDIK